MVDLGRPDQYGDASGVVELFSIEPRFQAGPAGGVSFDLLVTDSSPMLYRVRFVSVFGQATAGAGGFVLTFEGLTSALVGDPWPGGGPLVAAADAQVLQNEGFHYSWNTEVSDNYNNLDRDFGRVWVGGLPLMYLPRLTTFSLLYTAKGGYAGDYDLQGGHMQIERFAPGTVISGNAGASDLYLLPALG